MGLHSSKAGNMAVAVQSDLRKSINTEKSRAFEPALFSEGIDKAESMIYNLNKLFFGGLL